MIFANHYTQRSNPYRETIIATTRDILIGEIEKRLAETNGEGMRYSVKMVPRQGTFIDNVAVFEQIARRYRSRGCRFEKKNLSRITNFVLIFPGSKVR